MDLEVLLEQYCQEISNMMHWYDSSATYNDKDIDELFNLCNTLYNYTDHMEDTVLEYVIASEMFLEALVSSIDAPEGVRNLAQANKYAKFAYLSYIGEPLPEDGLQ